MGLFFERQGPQRLDPQVQSYLKSTRQIGTPDLWTQAVRRAKEEHVEEIAGPKAGDSGGASNDPQGAVDVEGREGKAKGRVLLSVDA
jgi:hypothetical protein